ncbi:LAGLIDADG family homing endonuclease, partial [Rhodococcus sp. EPR-157]|uniref:LAGLIDADG family homing endonuclease n=1 Tax=Rhodococcus sp. EPR-157 TaxID=1813677 RepID=UPI000A91DA2E
VEFSDGTVIVADAEHQWLTDTRASRKSAQAAAVGYNRTRNQKTFAEVRTTEEIADSVRCNTKDSRLNHSVVNAQPIQLPERELLVPPYTLGAWLGDGSSACAQITSADPEIITRIEGEGLRVTASSTSALRYVIQLPLESVDAKSCIVCGKEFVPFPLNVRTCGQSCGGKARFMSEPVAPPACVECGAPTTGLHRCLSCRRAIGTVQARLRTVGVLGNKHIPADYLRSAESQRRALLAGLLDTDGTVTGGGSAQFSVTSERLIRDVRELVVSLGYRAQLSTKRVKGRTEASSTAYTLTFATDDVVFGLHRKQMLHKERRAAGSTVRSGSRFIVDVRPVESLPVRCVEVDNAEHLYLASESMIPTHNSTLSMDFMRSCSIKHGMPSVIFSLEMSRT